MGRDVYLEVNMLRAIATRRYQIATIFALRWQEFVGRYMKWIIQVVFENVRKMLL